MRANRTLEIGTGLFVLLGFAALFFLTTQLPSSGLKLSSPKKGYHVTAEFDNIGDLKVGSPVTMAGVNIGEVDGIRFDPKSYRAVVSLRIDPQYNQIPDDSYASIQTAGLLGGKYIGFSPGGSDTYFKNGSKVEQTQSRANDLRISAGIDLIEEQRELGRLDDLAWSARAWNTERSAMECRIGVNSIRSQLFYLRQSLGLVRRRIRISLMLELLAE